jgi:hypothetical protein
MPVQSLSTLKDGRARDRIDRVEPRLREAGLRLVAHNLLVDQLTAEVASAFRRKRIDALVLKGPGLANWLYPNEIRVRTDVDMLVAPQSKARAVAVLKQHGFALGYRSRIVSVLPGDPGGVEYHRGCNPIERFRQRSSPQRAARPRARCETIDLHCSVLGLFGEPDAIWRELFARSEQLMLAGTLIAVPGRDFLLLHVCLHAAQHVGGTTCKAFEDLRRAIASADEEQWRRALALAHAFDGTVTFAAGLQCVSGGRVVARRLGLTEARSLRFSSNWDVKAVDRRLAAVLPRRGRVVQALIKLAKELAPPPEYMRTWWSPVARRGVPGLLSAYMWRIAWAIRHVSPRVFPPCRGAGR